MAQARLQISGSKPLAVQSAQVKVKMIDEVLVGLASVRHKIVVSLGGGVLHPQF